jgi:hypothetical protein
MSAELYQLKAFLMGSFLTWIYMKPRKNKVKELRFFGGKIHEKI